MARRVRRRGRAISLLIRFVRGVGKGGNEDDCVYVLYL